MSDLNNFLGQPYRGLPDVQTYKLNVTHTFSPGDIVAKNDTGTIVQFDGTWTAGNIGVQRTPAVYGVVADCETVQSGTSVITIVTKGHVNAKMTTPAIASPTIGASLGSGSCLIDEINVSLKNRATGATVINGLRLRLG